MTGIALGVLEERNLELGPKAAKKSKWKNWRLTRDKSDTAWLILDKQGSSGEHPVHGCVARTQRDHRRA